MKILSIKIFCGLLGLCALSSASGADVLVNKGATWSYLDNGSDQGVAWQLPAFNDSGWKIGPAELGYGDGGEATVVSYGPSSTAKYITTYFRRHFNVADPNAYASLTLNVLRDDGAVVYLNGVEVRRENMPAGTISYTTLTANTTSETAYFTSTVPANLLVAGDNVLAVELHQTTASSSDISFDLELLGNNTAALPIVVRGPYLQMATPNALTIRWRTDVATDSRVRFGTSQASLSQSVSDATLGTEHEVRLTGLAPETRYYYSVGSSTDTLSGGDAMTYFSTGPTAGTARPTRIWVIGDAGTGNDSQKAVYNAYRTFTGATSTNLWLMLGDNAYNSGTDTEFQNTVFAIYPEMLKQSPTWPTIGNHDAASADSATQSGPYYDIFTLPRNAEAGGVASGTEAYYSYDYGNIHFVVLDSQESSRSTTGAMMNWMKADLLATNADWVIAYWHHPPYSKGSHDSDTESQLVEMRQNFLPVLEDYGVDLVLGGHSHSYERSKFIDGHYGVSGTFSDATHVVQSGSGRSDGDGAYNKTAGGVAHDGAVYAVAGSSGKVETGALNHPAMYLSLSELGSMVLDVNGLKLDAKFLNNSGTVRDYFTISKGVAPPPPVSVNVTLQNGPNGYSGNVDSYVASNKASTNFGNATSVIADGADNKNGRMMGLLQWQVGSIPPNAIVESAALTLTVSNGSTGVYNVYALNTAWNESNVTWNSLNPTANLGTLVGSLPAGGTGAKQITLNAAGVALVQGWVNGTKANNGLIIVEVNNTSDDIVFRSSEYSTVSARPKLSLNYHLP